MNKLITSLLLFLALTTYSSAQTDKDLLYTFKRVLKYTEAMDFEKIMDYTYPKLFTISTREEMVETLKKSFESDEFSMSLDSAKIRKIFPVFTIKNESYAKLKYSMILHMKFKEEVDSSDDGKSKVFMATLMESKYGKGNVRYDKTGNSLVIHTFPESIAIKTKPTNKWYFVNTYKDDDLFLDMMFSKEVINKLKEYK